MNVSILISKTLQVLFKPAGITIAQNGGEFNVLGHYHLHVIPSYRNQSFADFYLPVDPFPANDYKALKDTKRKMQAVVIKLI
ncbi:hypothetical protein [Heyndrickxia acidicola]|uniref:HIT domain-containing protein n=1 Tax=Heyndrickxia acidicola TaxID=209389 RepID=A0ABU6MP84_9BACI|nr:hypothetical protein [Heyndrickxia acidicola]MED1205791.1 hypothetical protein [Heyndrickxia acidicola]